MGYKSISVRCQDCNEVWGELVERSEESEARFTCPVCGGEGKKTICAPAVLQASYPDGTKRKGFQELKEAAKLESKMYELPYEKRKEIRKEIKKIKGEK